MCSILRFTKLQVRVDIGIQKRARKNNDGLSYTKKSIQSMNS